MLGAIDLSTTRTLCPLRRHSKAAIKPPTPAPTIKHEIPDGGWKWTCLVENCGRSLLRSITWLRDMARILIALYIETFFYFILKEEQFSVPTSKHRWTYLYISTRLFQPLSKVRAFDMFATVLLAIYMFWRQQIAF